MKKKKVYRPFVMPALIAMLIIMIIPLLFAVYITLNDVNLLENGGAFAFVGLKNFKTFFTDKRALNSVLTSVKFLVGALALEMFLGVAISVFLDREFKGKSIIRALVIIPMFMTPVVSGLIWRAFFDPNAGIVSYVFKLITRQQLDMLGTRAGALWGIIIVDLWQWTPFVILLVMASLDALPEETVEAARVEGASEWQMIRYVKIPMVRPTIVMAAMLRALESLKAFDTIYVMTKGGPGSATETMNMYAYTVGFEFYRIGYATTISLLFTIVVSLILSNLVQRSNVL